VNCASEVMNKSELLLRLQVEIRRRGFGTFLDEPPSVAQGGTGVLPSTALLHLP
jgi:hypothetical protein